MRLHAVVLRMLIAAAAGACSPHHLVGEATLAGLDDEELCGRRSNLLNGALMARELARRGVDCAPYDEAALRQGFHLWFLSRAPAPALPRAGPTFAPPEAAAFEPATGPGLAEAPSGRTGPPAAAPEPDAPPAVLPPEPDASPAAAAPPAPGRRPAAPAPPRVAVAAAPLVTPACAARSVRTGDDDGRAAPAPERWAVAFRNACGFPIRVLYAQRPGGALTGATGLLQPGETSVPAPIEGGFRQPGYVVCSYEALPGDAPCRLAGSAR